MLSQQFLEPTKLATVSWCGSLPPPVSWTPPNCIFEVDDVLQEWTWANPFDLVHMRILDAAFTYEERDKLYDNCYKYVTFLMTTRASQSTWAIGTFAQVG